MKNQDRIKNLTLLREMVRTDFKLRYQGSVLGYLWSFLKPLFLFGILYIIFSKFLKFGEGVPFFNISLLLGIVVWNFFAEATTRSVTSIVDRGDLIRKIKIPRYLIVLSTIISAGINFLLSFLVVGVFVILSDADVTLRALYILPSVVELLLLVFAASFFLSAVYVHFRDINYIWEVVLQFVFYATPIIYPLSLIPNTTVKGLMLVNPMAQIVQDMRWALVYDGTERLATHSISSLNSIAPFAIVIIGFILGLAVFNNQAPSFAENV